MWISTKIRPSYRKSRDISSSFPKYNIGTTSLTIYTWKCHSIELHTPRSFFLSAHRSYSKSASEFPIFFWSIDPLDLSLIQARLRIMKHQAENWKMNLFQNQLSHASTPTSWWYHPLPRPYLRHTLPELPVLIYLLA